MTSSLLSFGLLLLGLGLAAAPGAQAQDGPDAPTTSPVSRTDAQPAAPGEIDLTVPVGAQGGPFGVGTATSWPAYGLSGTYRVNEQVTAEAILGLFGSVQSVAGRGWYRFKQDPTCDLYGFATAGMFRYDYIFDTESVLGFGGGAGIEFSWAKILDKPDFPPIYSNLDIGLVLANFEHYNWSGLSFGGGLHYRF